MRLEARTGAVWLGVLAICAGATAQPPETAFESEERVTAVDVVLELRHPRAEDATDELVWLRALDRAKVRVHEGGEARRIVELALPEAAGGEADVVEPWTAVIWLDLRLASGAAAAWAAGLLAEHAGALTALGAVEVVIADPEPRTLLGPTRDGEQLAASLSELALRPPAGDDALRSLRREYLEALADPEMAAELPDPEIVIATLAAEERRLVTRQLDTMTLELATYPAGARRALFLLTGGWDTDPTAFYRQETPGAAEAAGGVERTGALEDQTETFARILAGYGWSVVSLQPPPPAPLPEGFFLGRWFFPKRWPSPEYEQKVMINPYTLQLEPQDRLLLPIFKATYKQSLDPEKADAFLELGRALLAQGKLEDAADALRDALHHYARDHRTAARQAEAWLALAETLDALERADAANAARAQAMTVDPSIAERHPVLRAALTSPAAPLARIAEATAGAVVFGLEGLATVVEPLGRRVRLTYQRTGPPDGALRPLEVTVPGTAWQVAAPAFSRAGTPAAVARLRLERLLEGDVFVESLELDAAFDVALSAADETGTRNARIEVRLSAPNTETIADQEARWLRASAALARPPIVADLEGESPAATVLLGEPRQVALADLADWRHPIALDVPPGPHWLVVMVEDLLTGRWTADLIELDEPAPEP